MTTTTEERQHEVATKLAAVPTKSTAHMELQERIDGIEQMLDDLARLAAVDGCISAAWALEKLIAVADAAERIYAGPGEAYIHPWGFSYCVQRVISSKCDQYLSRDGLWMQERTCYGTRAEAESALSKAKEGNQ